MKVSNIITKGLAVLALSLFTSVVFAKEDPIIITKQIKEDPIIITKCIKEDPIIITK